MISVLDATDLKIIDLIIDEKTNEEIARNVGMSLGGIKKRLNKIFKELEVETRIGLVKRMYKGESNGFSVMPFYKTESSTIQNSSNERRYSGGNSLISSRVCNVLSACN